MNFNPQTIDNERQSKNHLENLYNLFYRNNLVRDEYLAKSFLLQDKPAEDRCYFDSILKNIREYLSFRYNENFLYCSFAYWDKNTKKIEPIKYLYSNTIENKIKELLDLLTEELVSNFAEHIYTNTQHLITSQNQSNNRRKHIVICKTKEKIFGEHQINSFDVENFKYENGVESVYEKDMLPKDYVNKFKETGFIESEELKEFVKELGIKDPKLINRYGLNLSIYKEISYLHPSEDFHYLFIKPDVGFIANIDNTSSEKTNEYNGILLIGLKGEMKNLNEEDVSLWELYSYKLLSVIALKDVKLLSESNLKLEALKVRATATSQIGHLLRYRLSPPKIYNERLGKKLQQILSKNDVQISEIHEAIRLNNATNEWLNKTETSQHILNIQAHLFEKSELKEQVFFEKDYWYSENNLDIKKSIMDIIEKVNTDEIRLHTNRSKWNSFDLEEPNTSLLIEPFISKTGKKVRPFEGFYEDLIFEILINIYKASPTDSNINLRIEYVDNETFSIANRISIKLFNARKNAYSKILNSFLTFNQFSSNMNVGGLTYWNNLLELSNCGDIFVKLEQKDSYYEFFTSLKLKGLKCIKLE